MDLSKLIRAWRSTEQMAVEIAASRAAMALVADRTNGNQARQAPVPTN